MTKEALKLALEALEVANSCVDGYYIPKGKTHLPEIELAITAIKESLANEALEKMAENARELGLDYGPEQDWIERERAVGYREGHQNAIKQMAQPEQEPVMEYPDYVAGIGWRNVQPPTQRPLIGLTDDEIVLIVADCASSHQHTDIHFARAIEAKLKEKNT